MKYNKKVSLVFLSLLMLSVFTVSLVSALGPDFKTLLSKADGTAPAWLNFVLGKAAEQDVFTAVLMFALVALVIYGLVKPMNIFGESKAINWSIAGIVSLIGIRFLPAGFLGMLATPSSALVAVIVAGVPLLILLGITKNENVAPYSRYVWGSYAVVCIILGLYNMFGVVNETTKQVNLFGWDMSVIGAVFFVFAVIAILFAAFSGFFFGKIRKLKVESQGKSAELEAKEKAIADLNLELAELEAQLVKGAISEEKYKAQVAKLKKRLKTSTSTN